MFEELKALRERVGPQVEKRLAQFRELGAKGRTVFDFRPFADLVYEADLFSELCFCLLTANSSALMGIKLQKTIGPEGFRHLSQEELEKAIASAGHRFARQRAHRIVKARESFHRVVELLSSQKDPRQVRELLSNPSSPYKVEGFGLKEASHFLRNIGYEGLAIVDRHVLRYLRERALLPPKSTLTKRLYLRAEGELQRVCDSLCMSQGELDLYIFYYKTGKVLK
ncbi:MAG: N-glycosylase/DNA lyase [Aquificaceae bacterium]|nr:N-glycosylase/DNA lyase [Aquificaceae bacterium]MDW8096802.1 N-glycosylase/DNA lyase [Aquificaceae bacterium]